MEGVVHKKKILHQMVILEMFEPFTVRDVNGESQGVLGLGFRV